MAQEGNSRFSPERYRAYLLVLARLRLRGARHRVDPSDVVQETLLKAHRKREQFRDGPEAQYRAWLRRILANVIADAFDKPPPEKTIRHDLDESASHLEKLLPAILSTPSQHAQHGEDLGRLAEALMQLSDDERTALELRYLQEPPKSLGDIAKQLNRPTAKAVARLLARGLEKLRTLLRDET